jgi:hypothetical protein
VGKIKWKEKKRGRIGHSFPFPKKSFVQIQTPIAEHQLSPFIIIIDRPLSIC